MSDDQVLLQAKNIHKSYPMGDVKLDVLKGIDLRVNKGEFLAVIGSSGSGKSTLLHILGALDSPDAGSVIFENQNITASSRSRLNKYRNSTVGFVFQFYHLLNELTVLENVYLPAMACRSTIQWISARDQAKKRAKMLLDQFKMSHRLKHCPHQLSGGERQRVAIARALMNEPRIILADEPTGNLDSKTGHEILDVFENLHKQGQTIVMVTHDINIANRIQRTINLEDGKIIQNQ